MADKFGYMKGAKGIDGTKDCGFQEKGVDSGAQAAMYGRSHWGVGGKGEVSSTFGGREGQGGGADIGGGKLAKSAVKGQRTTGKAKR